MNRFVTSFVHEARKRKALCRTQSKFIRHLRTGLIHLTLRAAPLNSVVWVRHNVVNRDSVIIIVFSCMMSVWSCTNTLFFIYIYKDVVFSGQAEYFYFSADFSLKIFLYYSWIIIEKERIYHILFEVCSFFFFAEYYREFHVPFIELSLALNIWL